MNRLPDLQIRADEHRSVWNKWSHNFVKALRGSFGAYR